MVAATVAAHVHGYRAKTSVSDVLEMVAPGPPEHGESVQEDHEGPGANFSNMETGTIGRDISMRPRPGSVDDLLGVKQVWLAHRTRWFNVMNLAVTTDLQGQNCSEPPLFLRSLRSCARVP